MKRFDNAVRITCVGWLMFIILGGLISLGADSLKNGLVFIAVGAALGTWVWTRRSRAALTTSLVVGGLHSVEQVAYLFADLSDGEGAFLVLSDSFGLIGGCVTVAGSILGLRSRRSAVGG